MKKIYSYLLIPFMALCVVSCNYTDLEPTDSVGDGTAFKNVANLEKALVGAYSTISLRTYLNQAEWGADNCRMGGQSGGNGGTSFTWAWTSSSGDYSSIWTNGYKTILNLNRIIDKSVDVVPANSDETTRLNDALGQAYFLRAYTNFMMLAFFSDFENGSSYGIPIVNHEVTLDQPGRNTVAECYEAITSDCQQALSLLKENAPADPKTVSKAAVNALLARMNLYRKNYSSAIQYANEALSAVPVAERDQYAGMWKDQNNKDVIWELRMMAGGTALGTMFFTADNGSITEASLQLVDTVFTDANDIRWAICIDKGPDRDNNTVDRCIKFIGGNPTANLGLCDMKMLRASEVMLIKIEATAQTNLTEANALLNAFRAKRHYLWVNENYNNLADFTKELVKERRKELVFEGHRWFDIRRYGLTITNPSDASKTMGPGDYRWILPIPDAECQANFTIVDQQNPGY